MKKLFAATLFLFAGASVHAQKEWQAPTNVKTYCLHIEKTIVSTFKEVIDRNRVLMDGSTITNPQAFEAEREAAQRFLDAQQVTWQRLGCASIIYGK